MMMVSALLVSNLVLLLLIAGLVFVLVRRVESSGMIADIGGGIDSLARSQERTERMLRDELGHLRTETAGHATALRLEVLGSLKDINDSTLRGVREVSTTIINTVDKMGCGQEARLESFAGELRELTRLNEARME